MARKVILITGVFILFTQSVFAETPWKWIRGSAVPRGWFVTQGEGQVFIKQDAVTAKLYDANDSSFLRLTLNGKITSGIVNLTTIVNATDLGPIEMVGNYTKKLTGRFMYEVIIVKSEFGFIALSRIEEK